MSKEQIVSKEQPIVIGCEVVDLTSGFKGIALSKHVQFNGNIRWSVQPQDKSGQKMLDAFTIDEAQLSVVGNGISDRVTKPTPFNLRLGRKLKNVITGEEGVATEVAFYLNGCSHFFLRPTDPEEEVLVVATTLLTDAGEGLPEATSAPGNKIVQAIFNPEEPQPKRGPGGPSSRLFRQPSVRL